MINRMSDKETGPEGGERRRPQVRDSDAGKIGRETLLRLVSGAAQLQEELLAPLAAGDRAHFLRCMKAGGQPSVREQRQGLKTSGICPGFQAAMPVS